MLKTARSFVAFLLLVLSTPSSAGCGRSIVDTVRYWFTSRAQLAEGLIDRVEKAAREQEAAPDSGADEAVADNLIALLALEKAGEDAGTRKLIRVLDRTVNSHSSGFLRTYLTSVLLPPVWMGAYAMLGIDRSPVEVPHLPRVRLLLSNAVEKLRAKYKGRLQSRAIDLAINDIAEEASFIIGLSKQRTEAKGRAITAGLVSQLVLALTPLHPGLYLQSKLERPIYVDNAVATLENSGEVTWK
ncbi:hypothetical protein K2X33_16175, partial [bacterium]|nr:hypothetical protein [bacterium]